MAPDMERFQHQTCDSRRKTACVEQQGIPPVENENISMDI